MVMDEILNGDPQAWRWHDVISVDVTLFFWILIGSYLFVILAMVVRAMLKLRSNKLSKPTIIGKSFSKYRRRKL